LSTHLVYVVLADETGCKRMLVEVVAMADVGRGLVVVVMAHK
jgi:hypothetical protein